LLSEIRFGSFLVYAPRGTNEVSRRAQQFVRALKEERLIGAPPQSPSDYAARRLAEEQPASLFDDLFAESPLQLQRLTQAVVTPLITNAPPAGGPTSEHSTRRSAFRLFRTCWSTSTLTPGHSCCNSALHGAIVPTHSSPACDRWRRSSRAAALRKPKRFAKTVPEYRGRLLQVER
jgi:hypothetical protein